MTRYDVEHLVAETCLLVIRTVCRVKDNSLAEKIHQTVGRYQTRPQEGWEPPETWDCWKDETLRT